jgi:hypothetical protein
VSAVSNGKELVDEAQVLLRDALMEIDDEEVRSIVDSAESSLDEALYMLETEQSDADDGERSGV